MINLLISLMTVLQCLCIGISYAEDLREMSPISSRIIFTGAPGSGKSSLINYLDQETDIPVVFEAATRVFQRRKAEGISAPWADLPGMMNKINHVNTQDMKKGPWGLSFWDRSLVDSVVYSQYFQIELHPRFVEDVEQMQTKYGFYQLVFLIELNPDPREFEMTEVRQRSAEEAMALEAMFEETYTRLGYEVRRIPWAPLEKRADLILKALGLRS